jgi:hypothetical protein
MRDTWNAQFKNHPDFKIRVQRVISDGESVGVFGWSEGTYAPDGIISEENHWEVPAAFLGIAREGKVAYWETYIGRLDRLRPDQVPLGRRHRQRAYDVGPDAEE